MFKIGDVVSINNDPESKGIIKNIIKHQTFYDYLVETENFTQWHPGEHLTLAEPTISKTETTTNQEIKHDADKPRLSLVPILPLWESVARIREYGVNKYGDNECWKEVELKRYHDALLRHTAAIANDLNSIDEESGMPHRWHIACNLAFIEYLIGDANV